MITTSHEAFLNLQEAAEALGMKPAALISHPHVHRLGSRKGDEWRFLASRCADFLLEPTSQEKLPVTRRTPSVLDPTVYLRGQTWYANILLDGRWVRRSLGESCSSEEEASERASKLQAQYRLGNLINPFVSRRARAKHGLQDDSRVEPFLARLGST